MRSMIIAHGALRTLQRERAYWKCNKFISPGDEVPFDVNVRIDGNLCWGGTAVGRPLFRCSQFHMI